MSNFVQGAGLLLAPYALSWLGVAYCRLVVTPLVEQQPSGVREGAAVGDRCVSGYARDSMPSESRAFEYEGWGGSVLVPVLHIALHVPNLPRSSRAGQPSSSPAPREADLSYTNESFQAPAVS